MPETRSLSLRSVSWSKEKGFFYDPDGAYYRRQDVDAVLRAHDDLFMAERILKEEVYKLRDALRAQEPPQCEFCQAPESDPPSMLEVCPTCWNKANEGSGWMQRALAAEKAQEPVQAQWQPRMDEGL